jgi:hypothetical protein
LQPGSTPPHDSRRGQLMPGAVAASTGKQEAVSSSCGPKGAAAAAAAAAAVACAACAAVQDCSSSASPTLHAELCEGSSLLVSSAAVAGSAPGPAAVAGDGADKAAASMCNSSSASAAGPAEADAAISGDGHFDAVEGCYKIVARTRCEGLLCPSACRPRCFETTAFVHVHVWSLCASLHDLLHV